MAFNGGFPPGPHAGEISPKTQALRPSIGLSETECDQARRYRRQELEFSEIAELLGAPEGSVRQALATMRTHNAAPTRQTLNVTIAAHNFVMGEMEAGEAVWETTDRLMGELAMWRAIMGAPITKQPQATDGG